MSTDNLNIRPIVSIKEKYMAVQDFDFKTKKVKNPKLRQSILAISDDKNMEELTQTMREKRLPVIGKTNNYRDAVELVRKHKVGVLFLDAELDGMELARFLQKTKTNYPDIRLVIVSGSPTKEHVDLVNEYHALGMLVKPISKPAVEKILKNI